MSFGLLLLAQQPGPAQPDFASSALPMLLFGIAFMYFLIIRPQRREQQEKDALVAALKKNDKVVTSGGMFGTIVNIKDDEVTLRIDDKAKVQVRFQKAAIARVLGAGGDDASESKSETKPEGQEAPKS